jgi:protein gp37
LYDKLKVGAEFGPITKEIKLEWVKKYLKALDEEVPFFVKGLKLTLKHIIRGVRGCLSANLYHS